jgi:hypothetical protein
MSDAESDTEQRQLDERAFEDDKRVIDGANTTEADELANAGGVFIAIFLFSRLRAPFDRSTDRCTN